MTVVLKSVVIWLVLIVVESLNGTARIIWLVPLLGDRLAHQVSFITGSILILAIATIWIRWLNPSSVLDVLRVGLLWLILTVLFEIGLGRFILGYSWEQVSADYNLLHGGLMSIGLVWLMLTPFIAAKLRGVSLHVSE